MNVHFDDIIYRLQAFGGVTEYWDNLTQRISAADGFTITRSKASLYARFLPVTTSADVFHSSHFRNPMSTKVRVVSTVHDLNYEKGFVDGYLGNKINIFQRKRSYQAADALICISENTKQELLECYPQLAGQTQIEVIHHGCEFVEANPYMLSKYSKQKPYILYVGGRKGYKNFDRLLRSFANSCCRKDGFDILCTGAGFDSDERNLMHALGISSNVHSVGNVPRDSLSALYQGAFCLVYPSSREGFGMPLVEAMQYQCPIIANRSSCIPEIVGDAAILVDVYSTEQLAAALDSLYGHSLRKELVAEGLERARLFSWEKCAAMHSKIYKNLA